MAILLLCGGAIVYTLAVFPLAIWALARWRSRPPKASTSSEPPFISVIIPVFNEAGILMEKLENCLALDYPADRIEFVFALDGCTDGSETVFAAVRDPRVRARLFPVNRGKVAVLNDIVPEARGEIVALSDASGMINPAGLREVASLFADPEVGGVSGIYQVRRDSGTELDSAEHSYLGLEMKLRYWEGLYRTSLSGTGSLFAFRKADFQPFPAGLINDDFVLPASLALRGRRIVYAPGARVLDRLSTPLRAVFRRRVRIAYGNWQQLGPLRGLLNPARGYLFWVFLSHKLMRTWLPFIVMLFLASSAVFGAAVFAGVMGAFLLLLLAGALGLWLDRHFSRWNPLGLLALIFINFAAVFVGTAKFIAGRRTAW